MANHARWTEEDVAALIQVAAPAIRSHVREEVALQLSGLSSRLSSIEGQVVSANEQAVQGRRETAGVAAMLTAFFGKDGTGGTLGLMISNSAADSRQANELAHKTFNHIDTIVGRGWTREDQEGQQQATDDKKRDRRFGFLKWGGGALATAGVFNRGWHLLSDWIRQHWH